MQMVLKHIKRSLISLLRELQLNCTEVYLFAKIWNPTSVTARPIGTAVGAWFTVNRESLQSISSIKVNANVFSKTPWYWIVKALLYKSVPKVYWQKWEKITVQVNSNHVQQQDWKQYKGSSTENPLRTPFIYTECDGAIKRNEQYASTS
jgi:hypothetical protein